VITVNFKNHRIHTIVLTSEEAIGLQK